MIDRARRTLPRVNIIKINFTLTFRRSHTLIYQRNSSHFMAENCYLNINLIAFIGRQRLKFLFVDL